MPTTPMGARQVTALERYITLCIGIGTIIGLLWRIAWNMGSFTREFRDHVTQDERVHADHEERIRSLEWTRRNPGRTRR
jgi:hypothetical protein